MTHTSTLGILLASAREKAGLSLQGISDRLRIKVVYLEAMEADRYEEIQQSPVFIRGYIRTYARLLGIEENMILALLDNNTVLGQKQPAESLKAPEPIKLKRYHKLLTYVIVGLLIVGVVVFWVSRTDNRPNLMAQNPVVAPSAATAESMTETTTPAPAEPSLETVTPVVPAPSKPAPTPDDTDQQFTMDYN